MSLHRFASLLSASTLAALCAACPGTGSDLCEDRVSQYTCSDSASDPTCYADDEDPVCADCGAGDCSSGQDAEDSCNTVLDSLCTKFAECFPTATFNECKDTLTETVDCNTVLLATSDADTCESDMEALECADFLGDEPNLPDSCDGVYLGAPEDETDDE